MHPEESEMATVQQVSRCTQVCLKGPGPAPWRIWRLSCRCLININRASRWPIIWTSPVAGKTGSRRQNVPCYSLFKFGIFDKFYVLFFFFSQYPCVSPWQRNGPGYFLKHLTCHQRERIKGEVPTRMLSGSLPVRWNTIRVFKNNGKKSFTGSFISFNLARLVLVHTGTRCRQIVENSLSSSAVCWSL